MLELRCASLQNDTQVYQDRIETILKQMEEVAAERDQVGQPDLSVSSKGCRGENPLSLQSQAGSNTQEVSQATDRSLSPSWPGPPDSRGLSQAVLP